MLRKLNPKDTDFFDSERHISYQHNFFHFNFFNALPKVTERPTH